MDVNETSCALGGVSPEGYDVTDVKFNVNNGDGEGEDEEDDGINSAMSCETAETDELNPIVRCRSNTWACSLQGGVETQESGIMVGETPGSSRESLVTLKKTTSGRRNAWGSKSYADIITQAIEASPERRLTLAQIYDWMTTNIPYFSDRGDGVHSAGWKNSIRHNLSLHDRFKRLPNEAGGKSSYWVNNYDAINKKASRNRAFTLDTKQYEKKRTIARNRLKAQQVGVADLSRTSDSSDDIRLRDFMGFTGDGSNTSSLHRLSPIGPITEGDEQQSMSFSAFASDAASTLEGASSSPLVRWGEDITDQDDDNGYLMPPYTSWDRIGMLESNRRTIENNERQEGDLLPRCNSFEVTDRIKLEGKSDVKANLIWGERVVNDRRGDVLFNDAAGTSASYFGEGGNGSSNTRAATQAQLNQAQSSFTHNCLPQQQDQLSDLLQTLLLKQQQQLGGGEGSLSIAPQQQLQLPVQHKDETLHGLLQQQSRLSEQHAIGQQLRAKAHNDTQQSNAVQQQAAVSQQNNSKPPMSNSDYLKLLKLPEFWMWGNPEMLAKIREILLAKRASTVAAAEQKRKRNENDAADEVNQLEQLLQLRSAQELSDMLMDGDRMVLDDTAAAASVARLNSNTQEQQQEERWTDSEAVTADDADGVPQSELDFDDARFEDVNQVIRQELGYDPVLDFNLDLSAQGLLTENDIDENK